MDLIELYELYNEITKLAERRRSRVLIKPDHWNRSLSSREIEILELVAKGKTNVQIAEDLGLSRLTVKTHLRNIGLAIGIGRREAMVIEALRAKIID